MRYIDTLLHSGKTIFTYDDIRVFFGITNHNTIKSIFQRLVKSGVLHLLSHGVYALPHYDYFEFATRLKTNSYISFETVLRQHAIVFQDYGNTIFLTSDKTLTKSIDGIQYRYHTIKSEILSNPLGIIQTGKYAIATPERAVCDRLYLSPTYYFDDIHSLDPQKLLSIAILYNKRVVLSVKKLLHVK